MLGIVTDRYQVVQNEEAFAFTDELLGEGVRYETAGVFQDGRKTWMLARLPSEYIMLGDRISPFMVFYNTHDVVLDLAITHRVLLNPMDDSKIAVIVTNQLLDKWGVEKEELKMAAFPNMEWIFPHFIKSVDEVISETTNVPLSLVRPMRLPPI